MTTTVANTNEQKGLKPCMQCHTKWSVLGANFCSECYHYAEDQFAQAVHSLFRDMERNCWDGRAKVDFRLPSGYMQDGWELTLDLDGTSESGYDLAVMDHASSIHQVHFATLEDVVIEAVAEAVLDAMKHLALSAVMAYRSLQIWDTDTEKNKGIEL